MDRDRKIINAILQKEKELCPGCIALIGVYGSTVRGDVHPLSDLDLLIVPNDKCGSLLSCAFVQDDLYVGHDLYCTSWDSLEEDAEYPHPHISKLMDSKILYSASDRDLERLNSLREHASEILSRPFDMNDYSKAYSLLKESMRYYTLLMISQDLTDARRYAGAMLYYLEDSVAMLNKRYFRLGKKRIFEEFDTMERRPDGLCGLIRSVAEADSHAGVREASTCLMNEVIHTFEEARRSLDTHRDEPSAENLSGTYEEMVSNWRGKMRLAAETGDAHLAFLSLASLDAMIQEISGRTDIRDYDPMKIYDPEDLSGTAERFDALLDSYLDEYRKRGMTEKRYPDIDSFVRDYLSENGD